MTTTRPSPPFGISGPATSMALALLLAVSGALPGLDASAAEPRRKPAAMRSDSASEMPAYGRREDVLALAADIAERHALDRDRVEAALAEARFVPSVVRLITPPAAGIAKNWAAYRARFIEPVRIAAGVAFWRDNERVLREAEQRWGVPPEIVVGIVGVETIYGRQMGNFRVIDALATLAFDFPVEQARRDRSAFFRDELESFLVLCQTEGVDPLAPLGSYAGAIGMPQFMPSSWLKYAVDFDGDGRTDLRASAADVIGSVANYLAEFGWQRDMPTHYAVTMPCGADDRATLLGPDIFPSFRAAQMADYGAALDAAGREHDGPLALVELQNGSAAPSYVAGTQNFYAITRYNQSSYYALAVIELGSAVAAVVRATR